VSAHPHVEATLVDLPGTIARAEGPFATRAQSFFDPLPRGADLYILRSILNDWADPETDAILRNVASAMTDAGHLVVSGGVAPDDAPRRLQIEMLLLGGTTDDLETFAHRARRAGLEVVTSDHQANGRFYVVLKR
jgi:hypothetical protein